MKREPAGFIGGLFWGMLLSGTFSAGGNFLAKSVLVCTGSVY
jgi:hypothetical protein